MYHYWGYQSFFDMASLVQIVLFFKKDNEKISLSGMPLHATLVRTTNFKSTSTSILHRYHFLLILPSCCCKDDILFKRFAVFVNCGPSPVSPPADNS